VNPFLFALTLNSAFNPNLERFDIAWKPTGLMAGGRRRRRLQRRAPLDFVQQLTNNQRSGPST